MKEAHLNGSGWRGIRLALSLALLKEEQLRVRDGVNVIASDPAFLPLYDDIKRFIFETGCGMLTESGEDIAFLPEHLPAGRYGVETGNFSSISEIELFILPSLFHRDSRSVINYRGVTHSHVSYPTVFLKETLFGFLEMYGFYASMNMKRFGFYGSGGGVAESRIYPAEKRFCDGMLDPRETGIEGFRVFVGKMDMSLAEREKDFILKNIAVPAERIQVMEIRDADGFGNTIQAYMKFGSLNVILSRDMEIYNSAGDLVFDEGKYYAGLGSLKEEVSLFVKSGRLPLYIAAEVIPYMFMRGMDVPEEYRGAWSYGICCQILG